MEIIVEGPSDLRFVHYLTSISKKKIIIARGIGNVFKQLEKRKHRQDAIAVIDEDKGKTHPKLWNDKQPFNDRELSETMSKMSLLIYLLWNMRLITLSPDLERWILKSAERNNVNPEDFKLSKNHKEFKRLLLDVSKSKQKKIEKFIDDLRTCDQFQALVNLLTDEC